MTRYGTSAMLLNRYGTPHPERRRYGRFDGQSDVPTGPGVFLLSNYGADPTGQDDSTRAIQAWLDAAGAYAAVNGAGSTVAYNDYGDVFFHIRPRTRMHIRCFQKDALGDWYAGGDTDGSVDAFVTNGPSWNDHWATQGAPEFADAKAGHAIDRWTGDVWYRATTGDQWALQETAAGYDYESSKTAGTNVRCCIFPPEPDWGTEGDCWWQFWEEYWDGPTDVAWKDTAIWLNQSHRYIEIDFNGAELRLFTAGGFHPDDYEVVQGEDTGDDIAKAAWAYKRTSDGLWYSTPGAGYTKKGVQARASNQIGDKCEVVVRSNIGVGTFWNSSATAQSVKGRRGSCIGFFSNGTHSVGSYVRDIELHSFNINGQASTTQDHSLYSYVQALTAWDEHHKGIIFSYGADGDMFNLSVHDFKVEHCQGELIYKGGGNECHLTLTDGECNYCNSSAISMGANLTVTRVSMHHVFNAYENYAFHADGHFLDIVGPCTIDVTGGGNGVVFIGEEGTPYLNITNATIIGAPTTGGGVFLANFGSDVTLDTVEFRDCGVGLKVWNQGDYSYAPRQFNRLILQDCTWRATGADMEFGINFINQLEAVGWQIINPTVVAENGYAVDEFLRDTCNTIVGNGHDVTVTNGDISAATFARNPQSVNESGFPPIWTNVTSGQDTISLTTVSPRSYVKIGSPQYVITNIPNSTAPTKSDVSTAFVISVTDRNNTPEGYSALIEIDLTTNQTRKLWLLAQDTDAASGYWNDLGPGEDIELSHGDWFRITKDATNNFQIVVYPGGVGL